MSPITCRLEHPTLFASWCCIKFPSFPLNLKQFRCHLFSRRVGLCITSFADRIETGNLDPQRETWISYTRNAFGRGSHISWLSCFDPKSRVYSLANLTSGS